MRVFGACSCRPLETASLAEWLRRPPRERKIPVSNPACARIFPGSSHTSDLINWHSRRLALKGQRWDWLTRCQCTVAGWDGKFDLQLLSQCGSTYTCLSRSVPEIHSHVAGTLSNQPTNKQTNKPIRDPTCRDLRWCTSLNTAWPPAAVRTCIHDTMIVIVINNY